MHPLIPVILSGGSGTRLWPLSRSMLPKQFIQFFNGGDAPSFLRQSLSRLPQGDGIVAPILICNNDHRFLVRDEIDRLGIEPSAIVLEPVARNTAAAVTVGALMARRMDDDAIVVVMPSDHVIRERAKFTQAVRRAAEVADAGKLVLFGIEPNEPHSGFGYIKQGQALDGLTGAFAVDHFTEKPDVAAAARYLEEGGYFWNSGIFVFKARSFIEELEHLEPTLLHAARIAIEKATHDLGFFRLDKAAFVEAPSLSVDHAVMEHTSRAAMLPIDVGWNDIGSWSSLWEIAPHDEHENYVHGEAVLTDTSGCYVHSEKALVSTIGLKDVVVVNTPDALLVADRRRSQDVSKIVAQLKRSNRKEHEQHLRNHRPWGSFETLNLGPRFQVKLLHVKPGGQLSMQMHHHRSEHWIVVHGTAKVSIGGCEKLVLENESVYITPAQWHRLENPGKVPLQLIEVQLGSYLGEDDILRDGDVYQRSAEETR